MVTYMSDYFILDPHDDDADFRFGYGNTMIAQCKQDLHNKNFSLQDQGKSDQIDILQKRIRFWLKNFDSGGPIPDNLCDYDYENEGLDLSVCGAKIFPEIRELKKILDVLK